MKAFMQSPMAPIALGKREAQALEESETSFFKLTVKVSTCCTLFSGQSHRPFFSPKVGSLPTVGSPSDTNTIMETELGSNMPKFWASFRMKVARRRASLIFVPVKDRMKRTSFILVESLAQSRSVLRF